MRRRAGSWLRGCWTLAGLAAGAAMAGGPMSYLRTHGPAADPVTRLNWGLLTISVVVCVVIGGLVLWASLRRRPPDTPDPSGRQRLGSTRGGMPWIYVGVGISSVVLLGSAVWTLLTLSAVAAPPHASLRVDVIGHQWWWEVRYPGDDPSQQIITANEIHIPVGQPVQLKLDSADVIHSFWVPQLAGKTDLIPGQTSYAWLQADRPGDYRGQCGEYCGAQHAHMALHVVAEPAAEFERWRQLQRSPAAAPADPAAQRGLEVFAMQCGMCHTVQGAGSHGVLGPDLTHLMARRTLAAGLLPNNTGALSGWIANPQDIKPGTRMPAMVLEPADLHAVVAYLETLK